MRKLDLFTKLYCKYHIFAIGILKGNILVSECWVSLHILVQDIPLDSSQIILNIRVKQPMVFLQEYACPVNSLENVEET